MKTKGSQLGRIKVLRTLGISVIRVRLQILQVRGIGVLIVLIITCVGSVMLLINIVITFLFIRSLLMMILSHVDGRIKKKKKN